ncbi:hypothetical protein FE697_019745 [Mumia zhuanghuii]|uniref:Uncharacterized protein n=2 Tax=Mumia TaxID=1546255 RepID=A0ABW1QQY0_9ACTN|nr:MULTISPECIES: hypothetical protein [Mumia]KAA1420111.1 hypothetical protein FE697_019745 [Mumia zhuanghuii]
MKSRIAFTVATAAGCAAALVLAAPPAAADERVREDRRDDAPASIDIARVTYRHTETRVAARIRVPELGRKGRASLAISRFGVFEAGYVAVVRKRPGDRTTTRLLFFDHFDAHPRSCDGLRGSWRRATGTIRISVPRTCLEGHRTRKVYVAARTIRGSSLDDARPVRRLARG